MNMFNVLTSASKVFAAFLGLGVIFALFIVAIAVIFIVFNIGFKPALNNANNATVLGSTAVVIQQFFHI